MSSRGALKEKREVCTVMLVFALLLTACATPASTRAAAPVSARPLSPSVLCQRHDPMRDGDPEQIRARTKEGVSFVSAQLQQCYEQLLVRNIGAKGRVLFEMSVHADGSVSDSCVRSSEIEDGEAIECMLTALHSMKTAPGESEIDVVLPLNFQPEHQPGGGP
jgi:hypothetical protein